MSGTVHTWLELEHTTDFAEDDVFARRDQLYELKMWDDRLVLSLVFTPKPPRRKRAGIRAWFEVRLFGYFNVGFDVARPGSTIRPLVVSETPWVPRTDEYELESLIWSLRDEALRLAGMLAKKPDDVSLRKAIDRA